MSLTESGLQAPHKPLLFASSTYPGGHARKHSRMDLSFFHLPPGWSPAMMDASGRDDDAPGACNGPPAQDPPDMDAELTVTGAIIDSWVEPAGSFRDGSRLVLQVAPQGRPKDLLIVEAEASLVPDRGWLEDLGENLCHGSPVAAVGRLTLRGFISAKALHFVR